MITLGEQGSNSVIFNRSIKTSVHEKMPPNGIAEYLPYCRDRYCAVFLQKFKFEIYELHADLLGGHYKYRNEHIRLQLLNDRGVFHIAISSNYGAENFKDINLLHSLLLPSGDSSFRIFQRELGTSYATRHEQSIDLMDTHYLAIANFFAVERYNQTTRTLEQFARKRGFS